MDKYIDYRNAKFADAEIVISTDNNYHKVFTKFTTELIDASTIPDRLQSYEIRQTDGTFICTIITHKPIHLYMDNVSLNIEVKNNGSKN